MARRLARFAIHVCIVALACVSLVCWAGSSEEDPYPDYVEPKVQIGLLQRVPTPCTPQATDGAHLTVAIELAARPQGTDTTSRKMVLNKEAFELTLGTEELGEGLDSGLRGACVGEKRRIHIPAVLGFAADGNEQYGVPPNSDLVATVTVNKIDPAPEGSEADDMPHSHEDEDDDDDYDGSGDDGGENTYSETFEDEVVILTSSNFDAKTAKKHAFILFHEPGSEESGMMRPLVSHAAKSFVNEGVNVVIGAVDVTAEKGLAERFNVNTVPSLIHVFGGSRSEAAPSGIQIHELVKFINKKAGTDRKPNGMLGTRDGRVPDNDVLVAEYLETKLTLKDLIQRLPDGSYYRRVAESIEKHGAGYALKEAERLQKLILDSQHVASDQRDSMQRRINVLRRFTKTDNVEGASHHHGNDEDDDEL